MKKFNEQLKQVEGKDNSVEKRARQSICQTFNFRKSVVSDLHAAGAECKKNILICVTLRQLKRNVVQCRGSQYIF